MSKGRVYILKLYDNKYYIGFSNNCEFRVQQHFSGQGSEWTKLHRPLMLVEVVEGDLSTEDSLVKRYMMTHGIDSTRGGSYSTIDLSEETKRLLTREFRHLSNCCFGCGESGHYIRNCGSQLCTTPLICSRCGRNNHTVERCYAKYHFVGGALLIDRANSTTISTDQTNSTATTGQPNVTDTKPCDRCGREGHLALFCRSTHDVESNPLGGGYIRTAWIEFANKFLG